MTSTKTDFSPVLRCGSLIFGLSPRESTAVSALGVLVLVVAILAVVALLLFLALFPVARRARRQKAELEAELGDTAQRSENAQGLGLESRGKGQVRGNGWLVLTPDELRFRQWVPSRETRMPLAAITAIETPRSWLGKSVGRKLLVVRWRTPEGGEDAMAWNVRDLDGWLAALGRPQPE
jgi:hypothetical protein